MSTGNSTAGTTRSQGSSLAYQLTSGKAYSPDAVYIDASDAKGHYEQFNVKLPPRLQNVIEIIVGENECFRSKQDFIRDALTHHAHRYATTPPEPDPLAVQLVEAQAARERTEMRTRVREEQRQDFKRAREYVEQLIEDRDWWAINEEMDRVALLSEDVTLPAGVREEYNLLWMELNDAVTRQKTLDIRRKQK